MIPDIQIIEDELQPKRFVAKDLTIERLESLQEAIIDFCNRSKSLATPMNSWSYIKGILKGQNQEELWWVIDGNNVISFLIMRVYQDFDGEWTAYTLFGYSKSKDGRDQYKKIIDDYRHRGVNRFQFTTIRNPKVFQRWLGNEWNPRGTLFQARYLP